MHLISITNLREDAAQYPDADRVIRNWFKTIEQAQWQNLEEVRQSFKDAEAVGIATAKAIETAIEIAARNAKSAYAD